jgi:hypothetical protein
MPPLAEVAASTGAKSGSRFAANTAMLWPTAQTSMPAIHCWSPGRARRRRVPLTIAMARGAPPSRIGSASAVQRRLEAVDMLAVPITRSAPRRRS